MELLPTEIHEHYAVIHFDGGCQPNPGSKYGSLSVSLDGRQVERNRIQFGHGTNNEAEFDALIGALDALTDMTATIGIEPSAIHVKVLTDSTIVSNWINRFHKVNPAKIKEVRRLAMHALTRQCIEKLKPFKSHEISWHSRSHNVARFGH